MDEEDFPELPKSKVEIQEVTDAIDSVTITETREAEIEYDDDSDSDETITGENVNEDGSGDTGIKISECQENGPEPEPVYVPYTLCLPDKKNPYTTPWSRRVGLPTVREEGFGNDDDDDDDDEKDNKNHRNRRYEPLSYSLYNNKKHRPSTRVVVRRLPAQMTKQEFKDAVSPLPEHDYLVIDNPDPEWGPNARSVVHINFKHEEDALWFIGRFNGYRFIDEEGEEHYSVCDFAMINNKFKGICKGKNPKRGKLYETEPWKEFLKEYEENPFQYSGVLPNEGEIVTTEMMLEEIEAKPKKFELQTTPLLDFIMQKKISKSRDKPRRERVRPDRSKRDSEDSAYREMKKERRRERREKERKERKEKDKLEREAKSKGMTVTYSKSGKVTRWSANSSPFAKKDKNGDEKSEEGSTEKLQSTSNGDKEKDKSKRSSSSSTPKDKYPTKSAKGNSEPSKKSDDFKKKPFNPFSKESKKIEKPSSEEKCRFGKPFPSKSDSSNKEKETKPSSEAPKAKTNYEVPTTSKAKPPFKSSESTEKSTKDTKEEDAKAPPPRKKIIKKIIRVKKVRDKTETEDGATGSSISKEGGEGSSKTSSDSKSESVKRPKSDRPPRDRESERPKANKETSKSEESKTSAEKSSESKTSTEKSSESSSSKKEEEGGGGPKRRRARPDMQIYRPGSLRSSAAAKSTDKAKPPPSASESKEKPKDKDAGF